MHSETLVVTVGPSRYGLALIEEKKLNLPSAVTLRSMCVLNSLAVRVALVYEMDGHLWVECHQRKGGANATYKDAWDVSAAGYIDPCNEEHLDPLDRKLVSGELPHLLPRPTDGRSCRDSPSVPSAHWGKPIQGFRRAAGIAGGSLANCVDIGAVNQ